MTYVVSNREPKMTPLFTDHLFRRRVDRSDVQLVQIVDNGAFFAWLQSKEKDLFTVRLHEVLLVSITSGHQENFYIFSGT